MPKEELGFAHLLLIIIVVVLIGVVGVLALGYLGIVKIPYITPEPPVESLNESALDRSVPPLPASSTDPNSGVATDSSVPKQTSADYLNPFDESVTYLNPFDSSNPFENL